MTTVKPSQLIILNIKQIQDLIHAIIVQEF